MALSLPIEKARALVQAAGLGEEVLQGNEAARDKLQQLRRQRVEHTSKPYFKSTTSGANTRDVQLIACRLANRLCVTFDETIGEARGDCRDGKPRGTNIMSQAWGGTSCLAAELAAKGGVTAVALVLRMFDASDLELMEEALTLALTLTRGCVAASADVEDSLSSTASSPLSYSHMSGSRKQEPEQTRELLPLLSAFHTPLICRRIAEVTKTFPQNGKIQWLCCLLVCELGSTCGAPARRCFAESSDSIISVVGGNLNDYESSDGNTAITKGDELFSNRSRSSSAAEGVREAGCRALAVLSQEPGLRHRLVTAGAGEAVTQAMQTAPRGREVHLACLQTLAVLAETNPGMLLDGEEDEGETAWESSSGIGSLAVPTLDRTCKVIVQSLQTFTSDMVVYKAACKAMLALLAGDSSGSTAHSLQEAGAATTLCHVLSNSYVSEEVQLTAVLSIDALLDICGAGSVARLRWNQPIEEEKLGKAATATGIEREIIAAGGCEMLVESAKVFPRQRDLRLGCLTNMSALCRGGRREAVRRLVRAGVCEQVWP